MLLLSAFPELFRKRFCPVHYHCSRVERPGSQQDGRGEACEIAATSSPARNWSIQFAYRLAQEFQHLLRAVREEVKRETDEALKKEKTRYKDATDGAWLEEREEYYKALTESLYLQRRAD